MKIRWEVQDGYVGKSRPHYCNIPEEEFEDCETEEDRKEVIENWVQGEFENVVSYSWEIED